MTAEQRPSREAADERVFASYGARAEEYVSAVGRMEHVDQADIDCVLRWARGIAGRVLDVGSGPGQWTDWLSQRGVRVEGVEPVPEFVALAEASYPESTFRLGRGESLNEANGAIGGVLAWYSLIHMPPADIDRALVEFARVIRPGGGLLLGFFTASKPGRFDHAIAPAYFWPVEQLGARVEAAGFAVRETETRQERPDREHGSISAIRSRIE